MPNTAAEPRQANMRAMFPALARWLASAPALTHWGPHQERRIRLLEFLFNRGGGSALDDTKATIAEARALGLWGLNTTDADIAATLKRTWTRRAAIMRLQPSNP
jgi:hypothetical protein